MEKAGLLKFLLVTTVASASVFGRTTAKIAPFYRSRANENPESGTGKYIVGIKEGKEPGFKVVDRVVNHLQILASRTKATATIEFKYGYIFPGFAATLSQDLLIELRNMEDVVYVEEDAAIKIHGGRPEASLPWGKDRVDQRLLPLDQLYLPLGDAGQGVHAYIVDTGLYFEHEEFEGRASAFIDTVVKNNTGASDCNGHGSHVGGILGGKTFGIANKVRLYSARVLDCIGSGTTSSVIAALEAITIGGEKPGVVNLSLGGQVSVSLDMAVNNLVGQGFTVVVSAGNQDADACLTSPARDGKAITVGASTVEDEISSFSNWGQCVNIFAPGSNIESAWIGDIKATATISGTSMSSPSVSGAAAILLGLKKELTPIEVKTALSEISTKGQLKNIKMASPNNLIYVGLDYE